MFADAMPELHTAVMSSAVAMPGALFIVCPLCVYHIAPVVCVSSFRVIRSLRYNKDQHIF